MAKKQLKGIVVSNKMSKTVVISVERIEKSAKYKRRFRSQKKYKVHTGEEKLNIGDIILIEETRPISKDRKWKLIKKIAESKMVELPEVDLKEVEDISAAENSEQK
jgi:small subunit ribosomal protein S17